MDGTNRCMVFTRVRVSMVVTCAFSVVTGSVSWSQGIYNCNTDLCGSNRAFISITGVSMVVTLVRMVVNMDMYGGIMGLDGSNLGLDDGIRGT